MAAQPPRMLLKHADLANVAEGDLKAILRAWCEVYSLRAPRFVLPDTEAIRDRIVAENVTVQWSRVWAWVEDPGSITSDCPASTAAKEWAVDGAVLIAVRKQGMVIPGSEDDSFVIVQSSVGDTQGDDTSVDALPPVDAVASAEDGPQPMSDVQDEVPNMRGEGTPEIGSTAAFRGKRLSGVTSPVTLGVGVADDEMDVDIPPPNQAALLPKAKTSVEGVMEQSSEPEPALDGEDTSVVVPEVKSPRLVALERALEAYGFIDTDYDSDMMVDDDDDDDVSHMSSDSEDDLMIDKKDMCDEYKDVLLQAGNPSDKSIVLLKKGEEKWPNDLVLHGSGDIAMFGRHYRSDSDRAEPLFFLMCDVPLRYHRGDLAVFVRTAVIARGVGASLQGLEGNFYMSLPVLVDGNEHRWRFAALDNKGHFHFTDDVDKIELRVLDGRSDNSALRHVFFAVDYILESVSNLIPRGSASTTTKAKDADDIDSDIECLDGPPTPTEPIKQESNPVQDAILRWLQEYRGGYYHTHPVVLEIRGLVVKEEEVDALPEPNDKAKAKAKAKSKGKDKAKDKRKDKRKRKNTKGKDTKGKDKRRRPQNFERLKSWVQIVAEINTIVETDGRDPLAPHKKISQIVIGRFLDRSHDWVHNCCRAQALLNQYGEDPAIQDLLKTLVTEALGVNKLLTGLREVVKEISAAALNVGGSAPAPAPPVVPLAGPATLVAHPAVPAKAARGVIASAAANAAAAHAAAVAHAATTAGVLAFPAVPATVAVHPSGPAKAANVKLPALPANAANVAMATKAMKAQKPSNSAASTSNATTTSNAANTSTAGPSGKGATGAKGAHVAHVVKVEKARAPKKGKGVAYAEDYDDGESAPYIEPDDMSEMELGSESESDLSSLSVSSSSESDSDSSSDEE